MRILGKIGRYFVILLFVAFSMTSIYLSLVGRGLDKDQDNPLLSYASFFEDRFYDLRMTRTINPKNRDNDIVLAALDDTAFQKLGRWPWTRTRWVEVLNKLQKYGAKVVAFDVVFPEPEKACTGVSPDLLFSQSITQFQSTGGGKVLLSYSLAEESEPAYKDLPEDLYNYVINTQGKEAIIPKKISSSNYPVPEIMKGGPSVGFIGSKADVDGIFRHYETITNVDTLYFPSLGLAAYLHLTDDKIVFETNKEGGILKLKHGKLPLNFFGEAKIRFLGGVENFPTIGMYEILKAKDDDPVMHKALKGKIVFIGSTAFGAHDLRHTPVDAQLPGVYFHMNFVHMLLKGFFFQPKENSLKVSLIVLLVCMILLFSFHFFGNAILDLVMINIIVFGSYTIDALYLLPQGYEVKLFFCYFCLVSCYTWETFLNFYKANKEKKQIKGTFARYVAPAIVNEMLSNPDKLKVGGEKRNITVIFSDVRDFTSISEKLTAQQLSLCLNQYMGKMTDILFDTYGTLDKYIGDALVGYWGAPIDVANHPYHAVRGAVQMVEALPAINDEFVKQGFPEFKIGIGLNTGECSVGNMGSDKIFSYTALGDNMNLGSRLESLSKNYGAQILISEFTYDAIPEENKKEFVFRQLDLVKVKGKENAVKIFEVLPSFHPYTKKPENLQMFSEAYQLYLSQDFTKAIKIFSVLLDGFPEDKASLRLMKSSEEFLKTPPPPDWDGVTVHKEK